MAIPLPINAHPMGLLLKIRVDCGLHIMYIHMRLLYLKTFLLFAHHSAIPTVPTGAITATHDTLAQEEVVVEAEGGHDHSQQTPPPRAEDKGQPQPTGVNRDVPQKATPR